METVSLSPPHVSKDSQLVSGSGSMGLGTSSRQGHLPMVGMDPAFDFCTKVLTMALNLFWKQPEKDGPCTFKAIEMSGLTWPSHGKKEVA